MWFTLHFNTGGRKFYAYVYIYCIWNALNKLWMKYEMLIRLSILERKIKLVLERESLLMGKLIRIVEGSSSDRRESRRRRRKGTAAENKQQHQNRFSGRPGRSTAHAQRAQCQRPVDRPVDRTVWLNRAQLSVVFGRPAGRPRWRSVDRTGRPTCTACTGSRGGRSAGLPQFPDCKCPTLCWAPGRPTGRPGEEVGTIV